MNQSFVDLFGYPREEVPGRNYFILTDPEVERHIRAAMQADASLTLEVSLRAKDGRDVWAAQFVNPMHDEQGALSSTLRRSGTSPAASEPSVAPSA